MLKYYVFAFVKANLLVFLIFYCMHLLGILEVFRHYCFPIWIISNIAFQILKMDYKTAGKVEEEWLFIKLTQGKKWYHRYFDQDVIDRLNYIKRL